jgi:hypothetical protein
MSNPKTAITEIKKLMKQFGFLAEEVSLRSFKLENNTILETPSLKVGNKITKLNDEFERVALEDGSYRLVENFEIEVKNSEIVTVKQIFLDSKLVDGSQIKVEGDELIEGARVLVVTEEAELPAPDGVHELEDGTKVETKDGVIVSIQAKIEEPVEEEMEDSIEKETEGEEKKVGEEEPEVEKDEMYQLLKDLMEKISEKMKKMEDKMSTIENQFNSFKKEPAGKKIADGKTDFTKITNNQEENRINAILQLRNKIK